MSLRRALFLDRDGTIIHDVGYPRDPEKVVLIEGAADALAHARQLGYALIIISNQSGVGRGWITPEEARAVQSRVEEVFQVEAGVVFEASYFCFHTPEDACACRKPKPGMLQLAAREHGLDLARSVMVGDKASDIEAGLAAGTAALSFGNSPQLGAKAHFSTWPNLLAWLVAHG